MEGSIVSQGKIFPGRVDLPPTYRKQDKDKGESTRAAIEGAREYKRDHDTIWTDGSKLDSGGVGVGIAWYEEVKEEGLQGLVQIDRKGELGKGARREKGKLGRYTYTYLDGQRSFREARSGWGWTETDQCWRCEKGRQSREHLFRECAAWRKEIRALWGGLREKR